MPDKRMVRRKAGKSSQPQRRGRPVVLPNSRPTSRKRSPDLSRSSGGNGPLPTLGVYAFTMPTTVSMEVGPTPQPVQAPRAVVEDEVGEGGGAFASARSTAR